MALRAKRTGLREKDLLRLTLELLNASGIPAWRQNAGSLVIREGRKKRIIRFGPKGMPDILGVVPPEGRILAVEVKGDPRKKLTPHQEAFLRAVEEAGGICAVIKSPEDLEELLRRLRCSP